jgi:two-component system, response regulator
MNEQVEILLIEDSEYDAELTFKAMKVKMPSVQYHHLRDGQEALDYLFHRHAYASATHTLPLLILLDLDQKYSGGGAYHIQRPG